MRNYKVEYLENLVETLYRRLEASETELASSRKHSESLLEEIERLRRYLKEARKAEDEIERLKIYIKATR